METPPRDKQPSGAVPPPKQIHARLKMQMEREMDIDGNPEIERMGDEMPVHVTALKPLDDDFDDEDLD